MGTVLFDSIIFKDPFQFNPDRFIDNNGHVTKPKELIPFGLGMPVCLGESVARMSLFLFIAAMVKDFDILPGDDRLPDLNGVFGM